MIAVLLALCWLACVFLAWAVVYGGERAERQSRP